MDIVRPSVRIVGYKIYHTSGGLHRKLAVVLLRIPVQVFAQIIQIVLLVIYDSYAELFRLLCHADPSPAFSLLYCKYI